VAEPGGSRRAVREAAPGKVNLVLQVGPRRGDGLHELCSLLASIELEDVVTVSVASADGGDVVAPTPSVEGPDICAAALAELRAALPDADLPSLAVAVDKRIPVAAGLGGGSADAAAVLRAGNELAGRPLDTAGLRAIGARLGADVPSQVEPGHAAVSGAGECVELVELPPLWFVLAPQERGLSTAAVYAEADRIGATRQALDMDAVRAAAGAEDPRALAAVLESDLQEAAFSLRPELRSVVARLKRAGALGALVSGSGPTVAGLFADERAARAGAGPEDIVTPIRNNQGSRRFSHPA
jgi:4-diphosphocytidyl-2-C-methyl-D-erythritol kinase